MHMCQYNIYAQRLKLWMTLARATTLEFSKQREERLPR